MNRPFQSRQVSISSSGYDSSLTGSFSSLASSDTLNEEHSNNGGINKRATYPRFDTIEGGLVIWNPSPGMPRSKSATSLEHYRELELNEMGRISRSGGNSPQSSASGASQFTGCKCSSQPSLWPISPTESILEIENEPYDDNTKKNTTYQRSYRAMYRYDSQGDGEVTFREGDEVEVIRRSENGWWLVRTSEKVGWGPSNFLQSLAS